MELEQQLAADLVPLQKLSKEQASELLHLILGFVVEPSRGDFQADLGAYSAKLAEASAPVDTKALKGLVKALLIFFQGSMQAGLVVPQLEARCAALGLSPELISAVAAQWHLFETRLVTSLLSKTIKENRLVDMDWSFGVTASSNDCDQVGKTFLQIKLTIDRGDVSQTAHDVVFMELSLEQFYQFLSSLERCQSYVELVA